MSCPAIARIQQPGETYSDASEARQRGFGALRELLCRLTRYERLVVCIDDLQWGNLETAALFAVLQRQPGAPDCLTLCTYRSEDREVSECLIRVLGDSLPGDSDAGLVTCEEIQLAPLSTDETRQLALAMLGTDDRAHLRKAEEIAAESHGEPFFVKVMAQHLAGPTDDGKFKSEDLAAVISRRIEQLPDECRALFDLAVVAARPLSARLLYDAAGTSSSQFVHLHRLRALRLVRQVGSDDRRIEPYHDRIRQTALANLDASKLADGCLRLARSCQATDDRPDAEFLADLLCRGGQKQEAGEYFIEAADAAAEALAFEHATMLYRRAIELLQPTGQRETTLRTSLAESLAYSHRSAEAAREFLRAAESASPNQCLSLQQQAALRLLTSGHVDEGILELARVLRAVGLRLPTKGWRSLAAFIWQQLLTRAQGINVDRPIVAEIAAEQQRLLDVCWTAVAGLSVVDPIRAGGFVALNLRIALRAGQPIYLVRALTGYVCHLSFTGTRVRGAVATNLTKLRRVARRNDGPYFRAAVEMARGVAAHLQGRWHAAVKSCDRSAEYLLDKRCRDVAWELDMSRTFALWALMYVGDVRELARRQPQLLHAAQQANDRFAILNFGTVVTTYVLLGADRPDEVRRQLENDRDLLSRQGFFVQNHMWLLASTFLELYCGEATVAWEAVADKWRNYQLSFLGQLQQARIDFLQMQGRAAVAAAASHGTRHASLPPARKIVARLRCEQAPWSTALALMLEAGIASVSGHRTDAADLLRAAAVALEAAHMKLFAAACRMHLGQITPGDIGREEYRRGQQAMRSLGVANPQRMACALVPGF